jgi:hypothetical protein
MVAEDDSVRSFEHSASEESKRLSSSGAGSRVILLLGFVLLLASPFLHACALASEFWNVGGQACGSFFSSSSASFVASLTLVGVSCFFVCERGWATVFAISISTERKKKNSTAAFSLGTKVFQ